MTFTKEPNVVDLWPTDLQKKLLQTLEDEFPSLNEYKDLLTKVLPAFSKGDAPAEKVPIGIIKTE